ncbi:MAG TPA: hypothetical protein VGJ05_10565 [Fimbriiglobus sp.]|jgi:hypothetical protein
MYRYGIVILASIALAGSPVLARDDKPKPKLPIGKDTTVVDGPLDKEGYIDYEAALNERLGKGISPETNANVLIWKALGPRPEGQGMPKEYFRLLGIEEPPAKGDYMLSMGRYIQDYLHQEASDDSPFYEQQSKACHQPWASSELPQFHAWLVLNEKPLAVVVEASKRTGYFNPLTPDRNDRGRESLLAANLPCLGRCREIVAALSARALLKTHEGQYDAAWQDLLAAHRLARLIGRGGTLIEALVCMASDQNVGLADLAYLERANLTAQQIRDRLADLRKLPPLPAVADKVDLGERFVFLDNLQLVRRFGLGALNSISGGKMPKKPDAEEEKALAAIDWEPALRESNKWYDRMVSDLRAPTRSERTRRHDSLRNDLIKLKNDVQKSGLAGFFSQPSGKPNKVVGKAIGEVMISLMMPAAGKVSEAADRTEQAQRNRHLAFALQAFKKDTGKFPAKLDELAPKYLPSVPDDLFSGKPLIYKPDEKGYLLYSVGTNGKDDGGRWYDDDPPGDDPRVRMPLPEWKPKK